MIVATTAAAVVTVVVAAAVVVVTVTIKTHHPGWSKSSWTFCWCQGAGEDQSQYEKVLDFLQNSKSDDSQEFPIPHEEKEPESEGMNKDVSSGTSRQKRFIDNPDNLWHNGIVPYTFTEDLSKRCAG